MRLVRTMMLTHLINRSLNTRRWYLDGLPRFLLAFEEAHVVLLAVDCDPRLPLAWDERMLGQGVKHTHIEAHTHVTYCK